jgi:hypothetical protein
MGNHPLPFFVDFAYHSRKKMLKLRIIDESGKRTCWNEYESDLPEANRMLVFLYSGHRFKDDKTLSKSDRLACLKTLIRRARKVCGVESARVVAECLELDLSSSFFLRGSY